MKTYLHLVLTLLLMSAAATAQTGRREGQTASVYHRQYQRMATGCNSQSGFEIRNGVLWAWGNNAYGQLGDSSTTDRRISVPVLSTAANWQRLAAGEGHVLALRSDGSLWAWGQNVNGQLGDGTKVSKPVPAQVGSDTDWVDIACGAQHSIALKSNGTLWTWGYNNAGQLGLGNYTAHTAPVQVGTDNKWVAIAAGYNHTLALKADGSLWAWGWSNFGQVGDGSHNIRNAPVRIGTDTNWASIACGIYHSLALKSDGSLWAWGSNFNFRLGDSTTTDRTAPVRIGRKNNWTRIAAGINHGLALQSDGSLWAWGSNSSSQLGDSLYSTARIPVHIGQASDWVDISAGYQHNYALKADGSLWTWGINTEGALGDSSLPYANAPFLLQRSNREWLQVATGSSHSIALKSDGTLWAWGGNADGQLGDGSLLGKVSPIQVGASNQWTAVACGSAHNLALRADGSLWAWGKNANGQLGNSTTGSLSTAAQVGTAQDWTGIACGAHHSAALKSDGTLWAWGSNMNGQLGDGTTTDKSSPQRLSADSNWIAVAAGTGHTLALKSDGTLWAWGLNSAGQLGDGSTTSHSSPVQIGAGYTWRSIAAGSNHSLALRNDGTLWGWGDNASGQLGDGSTTSRSTPVQIGAGIKWASISASENHSMARSTGGGLWAWGSNAQGQLGTGGSSNASTPVFISGQSNVVAFSGSSSANHSARIAARRTSICMTGKNSDGQLGNGSTIASNVYQCSNDICRSFSLPAVAGSSLTRALAGIGSRTDFETACNLLASVTPAGSSPAAGTATVQVYVDGSVQSFNGHAYVQRHYDIQPSANATTATAAVTLYFTQAEFDAYNAANGTDADLPTGPADATGVSNLRVSHFHGAPSGGYAPGDYGKTWGGSGPANVLLVPASVRWNGDDNRWEVTVSVTGFSGFFVHGDKGGTPLPVELESFDAKLISPAEVQLSWDVAADAGASLFEVERSADGQHFSANGSRPRTGAQHYALSDNEPLPGRSFYRLRLNGPSGSSYSVVRSILIDAVSPVRIHPVPARGFFIIESADATLHQGILSDLQGRDLMHVELQPGANRVNTSLLPAGNYILRLNSGQRFRIVVE